MGSVARTRVPPSGGELDRAASPQLGDPLTHRGDPDAGPVAHREPDPIIRHFDVDLVLDPDDDPAVMGVGMPIHVGQGLQHDPVAGDLDGGRQRRHFVGCVDEDLEPAGGELPSLFPDGGDDAQLVQRRGSQVVYDAADVGDHALDLLAQFVHPLLGGAGIFLDQVADGAGLQAERGQGRADGVVQVASKTAAFLLARQHQVLARPTAGRAPAARPGRPPRLRRRSPPGDGSPRRSAGGRRP